MVDYIAKTNLDEDGIEIFDDLETLENSLAIDTKMGLAQVM